jgi:hypothetical protein
MIRRLDTGAPRVVAYAIDGTLTTDDIGTLHRDLRATIAEHGAARLIMDVGGVGGAEPLAVVKDLKLTPEYVNDVERYAIVGDARWQEWLTGATDLLTRGEARYFGADEHERAREWIGG